MDERHGAVAWQASHYISRTDQVGAGGIIWYNVHLMKCELCHNADACEAIVPEGRSEDDELYVCSACAKAEHDKRQKRSQRTRKVTGLPPGVSMSITEISPEGSDEGCEPPPFIGAIMNAFQDMVSGLENGGGKKERRPNPSKDVLELPAGRIPAEYRIKGGFHLEGLHLLGELDAVKRGLHALGMDIVGIAADGVNEAGHVYTFRYCGSVERAKRVAEDILREEKNARVRLKTELPRVFGDSLCRALAILKNCRLLSPGELFDLLSPMRLAARQKMLDGITLAEIERMMADADLSGSEDKLSQDERDRVDADRADEMNRRFEEVMLDDVL